MFRTVNNNVGLLTPCNSKDKNRGKYQKPDLMRWTAWRKLLGRSTLSRTVNPQWLGTSRARAINSLTSLVFSSELLPV